jgi:hypothetical protein
MRGMEPIIKLEDVETSHTLDGASYTTRDIDLTVAARGWAGLQKPMGLGVCVRGESGYGEAACSQALFLLSSKEQARKGKASSSLFAAE